MSAALERQTECPYVAKRDTLFLKIILELNHEKKTKK